MKSLTLSNRAPRPGQPLLRAVTVHDLYKTFAVMTMVADHVGYYFFPGEPWLRVIGRLSVPVWFFLIGFARSRNIGPALWLGGLLLVGGDMLAGQSVFPVNVLFTILATRLLLPVLTGLADRGPAYALGVLAILAALVTPSNTVCEYGTLAPLLALYGHALRRRRDGADENRHLAVLAGLCSGIAFFAYDQLWFDFTPLPLAAFVIGMVLIMAALTLFRPGELPNLTRRLPVPARTVLRVCGRHTLMIYVTHLLMFKALGCLLDPERFMWLNWKFYSVTGT